MPPRIVEPLIALSIAYVAIENIFLSELKPWRVALVFAFGLLHGMGFAGALQELGLPRSEFADGAGDLQRRRRGGTAGGDRRRLRAGRMARARTSPGTASRIVVPASVAIACTAIYWTITRVTL